MLKQFTFHKLDWLEYITLVLGIWFYVYPKPYTVLFIILLIIPILGLILNGINGRPSIASLVKISKGEYFENKYDVADFIDFAAIAIFIRVLIDFEFESLYSLIIPGSITFIFMLIILFTTHKSIKDSSANKFWIYGSLIFNLFIYSFSATYGINCVFDDTPPKIFEVKVIDKSIHKSRRHTSYYIKVSPWGHHHDYENISVPSSQYRSIDIGQIVHIDLKKGLLNIPWYYVNNSNIRQFVSHPIARIKLLIPDSKDKNGLISILNKDSIIGSINSVGIDYDFDLEFNKKYVFICSKKGYTSKYLVINTSIPKNFRFTNLPPIEFNVELFQDKFQRDHDSMLYVGGFIFNKYQEKFIAFKKT